MQSVVLYNVAAFRIARLSLEDAFGNTSEEEIKAAELEVNSIANLDQGLGVDSLNAMVPILKAQLYLVQRKWKDADEQYGRALPEAATYGQLRWEPRFLAEQAHCQAMLGMHDGAHALIQRATEQLSNRVDPDDLAAAHARIACTLTVLDRTQDAGEHLTKAKEYLLQHAAKQRMHRTHIEGLLSE